MTLASCSKQTGDSGEMIAAVFLESLGYRILERGWRTGRLEVDIVAISPDSVLHIVEVKSRTVSHGSSSDQAHGKTSDFAPEKAMTAAKSERIIKAGQQYALQNGFAGEISLDLVAVELPGGGRAEPRVRHYQGVQWDMAAGGQRYP